MAKQFIDLHNDLFIIVDEHIDEINDGETILVADEDAIYECTIRIHECGNEAPLTHWREAEYVRCIKRDDLCVISLTYTDEDYMIHYNMQIVGNDEVESIQQFNETVKIISQKEVNIMAKKYICPICGYIHEATEQPAQCPACCGDQPMKEIDRFETEWFGPYECEMVVTTDGKRAMI